MMKLNVMAKVSYFGIHRICVVSRKYPHGNQGVSGARVGRRGGDHESVELPVMRDMLGAVWIVDVVLNRRIQINVGDCRFRFSRLHALPVRQVQIAFDCDPLGIVRSAIGELERSVPFISVRKDERVSSVGVVDCGLQISAES